MSKQGLVENIARELLDNDMLNVFDFNGDTQTVLEVTQNIILERIKDYYILTGEVF